MCCMSHNYGQKKETGKLTLLTVFVAGVANFPYAFIQWFHRRFDSWLELSLRALVSSNKCPKFLIICRSQFRGSHAWTCLDKSSNRCEHF